MSLKIYIPAYIGHLSEYAVSNLRKNGFKTEGEISTTLKVSLAPREAIFEQSLTDTQGRHLLDCRDIFHLAKAILDDENRNFSRIRITLEIVDGKLKNTTVKLFTSK